MFGHYNGLNAILTHKQTNFENLLNWDMKISEENTVIHKSNTIGFLIESFVLIHTNFKSFGWCTSLSKCLKNDNVPITTPLSSCAMDKDAEIFDKIRTTSYATMNTDEEFFPTHKDILAARLPVFRAMFKKDNMSDSRSGVVDIEDVDCKTLDRVLGFLYGGSLENLQWEEVSALYHAADKYAVLPLKQKCADILKNGVSVNNACELLTLADTHSDERLMQRAVDFIRDRQEVISSPKWEELEVGKPWLTSKILREFFLSNKRKK